MAVGLVSVIAGLAVGVALLGGPDPGRHLQAEPCAKAEQWETDAKALADELADVPGPEASRLRQDLATEGFVPGDSPPSSQGGARPPAEGGLPQVLVDLLIAIVSALDTDGDGEVGVTVLGGDSAVLEAPGQACAGSAPPAGPAPDRPRREEPGADPVPADPEPAEPGGTGGTGG
jgi:hypothetical protein